MNENEFKAVLAEYPTLTSVGFDDPNDPQFAEHRRTLEQSYEAARLSAVWLSHYRVPKDFDSYTLKHCVEHEFPSVFIPEGATIVAAMHLGFPRQKTRHIVFGRTKPGSRITERERHEWHPIRRSGCGLLSMKPDIGDVSLATWPAETPIGQQSGCVIGTNWGWKRVPDRTVKLLVRIGKARVLDGMLDLPQRPPIYKAGDVR